jgi:hypothetical protein
MRHELTLEKFQAGPDGFMPVPDRPGLGLTLNEDFVKHVSRRGVRAGMHETCSRRWLNLAFLMALCFISHFNRASITSAGDERIMSQSGISPERMGVIYSAFLIVYTLFMIPAAG